MNNEWYMDLAITVSQRSTCPRRQVGCVIVSSEGRILSTGHNGVPSGFPHCRDLPCGGQNASGPENLGLCLAVHAEQNALLYAAPDKIHEIYVTTAPCFECAKLIANTPCKKLYFSEGYPDPRSKLIFETSKIEVEVIAMSPGGNRLESGLESKCKYYAESKGWLSYKFTSPGNRGVPDRIFIRDGQVLFVEFKAEGKKLDPVQKMVIDRMQYKGAEVAVIDNLEDFQQLLEGREGA